MGIDFSNIINKIKSGEITKQDIDKLKNSAGEDNSKWQVNSLNLPHGEKSVKETSIFDVDALNDKNSFVDTLYDDMGVNAYSKEDLGILYELVEAYDGEDGITEEDLNALTDGDNDISSDGVAQFINNIEEALANDENPKNVAGDAKVAETNPAVKPAAIIKTNDKIKVDENNNKYVNVEAWTKQNAKDATANNTLTRIISNSYDLEKMGIEVGSADYQALEKAVMDANPDIYGTEDGGWRKEVGGSGRHNAVIHDGEKVYIPEWNPNVDE